MVREPSTHSLGSRNLKEFDELSVREFRKWRDTFPQAEIPDDSSLAFRLKYQRFSANVRGADHTTRRCIERGAPLTTIAIEESADALSLRFERIAKCRFRDRGGILPLRWD
jgi:hypothetical protein